MKRRLTNKQKQKIEIKAKRRYEKDRLKSGLIPISAIIADMQLMDVRSDGDGIIISFGSGS